MTETLYEITRELVILNNLDEADLTNGQEGNDKLEQFKQALDNLNMKFIDKVCNIVKFIKNLEGHREVLATEAKRLAERKRLFDSRIDWLKNYLKKSIEATQSEKIRYSLFTIYVAPSQPSVEVRNIDEVDEEFIKIRKEVDKIKIMEQVKFTGVIPRGVDIVHGTHLVIR